MAERIAPVQIPPLDEAARASTRQRLDSLTKPHGSLGRLEQLAEALAGMTGNPRCTFPQKAVIVLAADHGVAAEAVSAYPSEVTRQMLQNFANGGAAINVLARRPGARVVVADFGVAGGHKPVAGIISRRIGDGTANMAAGPAMTHTQAVAAIEAGRALAAEVAAEGVSPIGVGEMGIGNTSAASAITAAVIGRPVAEVTGRGAGLDDVGLAHKITVIEQALRVNAPDPADPVGVLAKVGGFEIGGLAGVILGAAERRIPVILDGFITGAAALIAEAIAPGVRAFMVASHRSVERGHPVVLSRLGLEPLLDLQVRLGEGTGAVIAMQLIDDAVAIRDEMATFAEAGVAGPADS